MKLRLVFILSAFVLGSALAYETWEPQQSYWQQYGDQSYNYQEQQSPADDRQTEYGYQYAEPTQDQYEQYYQHPQSQYDQYYQHPQQQYAVAKQSRPKTFIQKARAVVAKVLGSMGLGPLAIQERQLFGIPLPLLIAAAVAATAAAGGGAFTLANTLREQGDKIDDQEKEINNLKALPSQIAALQASLASAEATIASLQNSITTTTAAPASTTVRRRRR